MDMFLMVRTVSFLLFTALFLLIYVPLALVVKMVVRVIVRPWRKEDLIGKVVLITGASSGIGEQLAYQYASKGARLALVATRQQALSDVGTAARSRGAADVLVIPADVADPRESQRIVEETVAHFGKLDHLVANAGIWSVCRFDEITDITAFTKMMDVNFWGSVYPTYFALPHLKASKGRIVVTASTAGLFATSRMGMCNASKAAQFLFYKTLRAELGTEVGITILTPGYVEAETTKGKFLQKDGKLAFNVEERDAQIGVLPIGKKERLAAIAINSIRAGDWCVTWPYWYKGLQLMERLAPELEYVVARLLYGGGRGGVEPLNKKLLDLTNAKRLLYPASLLLPIDKNEPVEE